MSTEQKDRKTMDRRTAKRPKRLLLGLVMTGTLLLLYLLLWPVPIEPAAWTTPTVPALTGSYEVNTHLGPVERLGAGAGVGPEDVAVDRQGRVYGGMEDGRILRFQADGDRPEVFAQTGGRPLGLHFDAVGNLLVADAYKGLLSIGPDGSITVLSTEQGEVPFGLTNAVDVAADGTVYFSDATFKFNLAEHLLDFLEHRPNGRLLAYDPRTGATRLVLDQLYFANGVAVSPDQSYVLIVETGAYRVRRYWRAGARQGEVETLIDNLPGFPDGISSNGKEVFWLALVLPRDPILDRILLPRPFLRTVVARLPKALVPIRRGHGFVLGLDGEGHIIHNLQGPAGSYA